MAYWREKINPKLRTYLEAQIAETKNAADSYLSAEDPANAQLWVAVANLARQCFELNVKVSNIDTALRDSLVQHQAALENLVSKHLKPKSAAKKPSKKKAKAAKRKVKAKKVSKTVRSARATAAATAKKVAEKIAKKVAKASRKPRHKKKKYVLLKEV